MRETAIGAIQNGVLLSLTEMGVWVTIEGTGHRGSIVVCGVRKAEGMSEFMHHAAIPAIHITAFTCCAIRVVSTNKHPANVCASTCSSAFCTDFTYVSPAIVGGSEIETSALRSSICMFATEYQYFSPHWGVFS
jgi:hypothetical protein